MGVLPDWCEPLPDAEAMRSIDKWAIDERHVPSMQLMERAGVGVARAAESLAGGGPVVVLCGKGNNAGDGLVASRVLRDGGREVHVLMCGPEGELDGDAAENLAKLPGERPVRLEDGGAGALASAGVIVDALLGTGAAGAPRGPVADAVAAINDARAPVVSVDVPTGVDASTGAVAGAAVKATLTVTFHLAKPGLWIHPGKAFAGSVHVLDIGIPRGAPVAARVGLLGGVVAAGLPARGASSTKFSSGHVVVAGGSGDLSGAPCMAALAAMRAGAGYVTACVPAAIQHVVACAAPELMTRGLPEEGCELTQAGAERVLEALSPKGALALGPGLGRSEGASAFARDLAQRAGVPTVIDADGLGAHAGRLGELRTRGAPTVLTPHAGELARLLECDSQEVQDARLAKVTDAAVQSGAVVVLKGDDTLVAAPGGVVAVSKGDSPALATAGTGDVLSGVIAALLAQGVDPFRAAAAGVWLHASAGRRAARAHGVAEGVIASDVIAALPAARVRWSGR